MKADFSGYATKAGLKCTDGVTILPGAFKRNDGKKVPLVWQHRRNESQNILGHVILEHRADGVYTYAWFNQSPQALRAKMLVEHGDIEALSIYARDVEMDDSLGVTDGDIKEVSLVVAGANPGAYIETVSMAHADDPDGPRDVIIYTGLTLEHADEDGDDEDDSDDETLTVAEIYETFTEEQKAVVAYLVDTARDLDSVEHSAESDAESEDDEDDSESEEEAPEVESEGDEDDSESDDETAASESDDDEDEDKSDEDPSEEQDTNIEHATEGSDIMARNVFDKTVEAAGGKTTLTHSELETIVSDAERIGSFKESFIQHAATYGIEDIDILFPDAKATSASPELLARRSEWAQVLLNGVKHSPFSRIKSIVADLTADEARAKGYVKGTLKKEEIIKLLRRVTTPTTVYKKQKLDRDDVVDITDLDVITWIKGEMRLMLDEEIARAILLGDGREADDEDKISEDHLRPIVSDNPMYAYQVTVSGHLDVNNRVEAIIRARTHYRGSGSPVYFTTENELTDMLLAKDKVGRRLYPSIQDLAAALRVSQIVTVEVMDEYPTIVGVLVSLRDYTVGADKGGKVSMFDDFDIDYNQFKYLIETRISGALTKPRAAVILNRAAGNVVVPQVPSYNSETKVITIPTTEGVEYSINETVVSGTVTITETTDVTAAPVEGFSFPANTVSEWTFTYVA